jgi:hypothetical protein
MTKGRSPGRRDLRRSMGFIAIENTKEKASGQLLREAALRLSGLGIRPSRAGAIDSARANPHLSVGYLEVLGKGLCVAAAFGKGIIVEIEHFVLQTIF